ncbi:MAG: formate--phosphoribosylaminoimidazolecarboxamide ligase family protein [Thermoplasmata archaeon]|nr:formate--phosphoribosylaminoimidazolecarboxamide ligase family protein [Thermoplasmata archaeon]
MIDRSDIQDIVTRYDRKKIHVGMTASHSALDVCDGAAEEGLPTLAVCQKGRDMAYSTYFRAERDDSGKLVRGMVDDVMMLPKFNDVLLEANQEKLRKKNVLFVPNRSFTSYSDITEIENDFRVPIFGSRNLLRSEDRGEDRDYYWMLEKAGLPFPEKIHDPKDIDCLCIIKLAHKVKKLERGFFTASSYEEYQKKSKQLLKNDVITKEDLAVARMEKYIIGPVFNLDFFYSPIEPKMSKLELIGIDWRFETSLDGHCRLPAPQQMSLVGAQETPEYTVCGHNSSTLRESLLDAAFAMGEKYVEACAEHYSPGIIGPFCLQTCVDKDLKFYIYDVAPRVGGGTNVHMAVGHPYGNSLWRTNMSTGRRIALEIKRALAMNKLDKIVT